MRAPEYHDVSLRNVVDGYISSRVVKSMKPPSKTICGCVFSGSGSAPRRRCTLTTTAVPAPKSEAKSNGFFRSAWGQMTSRW